MQSELRAILASGVRSIIATSVCTMMLSLPSDAPGMSISFTGVGQLPGGNPVSSSANRVSADGQTVIGSSFSNIGQVGFMWTASSGIQFVPFPAGSGNSSQGVNGVSANGTIVGGAWGPNTVPFSYTSSTGSVALSGPTPTTAVAISPDGSFIAGLTGPASQQYVVWDNGNLIDTGIAAVSNVSEASGISDIGHILAGTTIVNNNDEAFTWTASGGVNYLSGPSVARDISANGNVVVGSVEVAPGISEPAEWTASTGWKVLGDPFGAGFGGYANGVSADGSVIVGEIDSPTGPEAFIWDKDTGMHLLDNVLLNNGATDLSSWTLTAANDVSADGTTIVGSGINPDGNPEGWVATLPASALVPLPTAAASGIGLLGLVLIGKFQRSARSI